MLKSPPFLYCSTVASNVNWIPRVRLEEIFPQDLVLYKKETMACGKVNSSWDTLTAPHYRMLRVLLTRVTHCVHLWIRSLPCWWKWDTFLANAKPCIDALLSNTEIIFIMCGMLLLSFWQENNVFTAIPHFFLSFLFLIFLIWLCLFAQLLLDFHFFHFSFW